MKKTALLLLILTFIASSVYAAPSSIGNKKAKGAFGYSLYDDISRKPNTTTNNKQNNENAPSEIVDGVQLYGENTEAEWLTDKMYYQNADLNNAVNKYKNGNFSGCLQEMISLTKIDPLNPIVYYYMGMAYTQVGNKEQAVKAYEQVIKLNPEKTLTKYAVKGRDCLVGGPTCAPDTAGSEADQKLDEFINSPYGNGFSEELNNEVRKQQLKNIKKNINNKPELDREDIEEIQEFDRKGELPVESKISQEPSNDDILAAIETLKKAGIMVSVNPYQTMPINNQYNELGMLLGNNNNNNNSMMNMLPYLLAQNQNGQNIDPQIFQSMMMNSMIPDFTFDNNDKKY